MPRTSSPSYHGGVIVRSCAAFPKRCCATCGFASVRLSYHSAACALGIRSPLRSQSLSTDLVYSCIFDSAVDIRKDVELACKNSH